ncbi:pilus assembly protein [Pseudomonas fluorescens]|uniref:Fimbria/pilus periplasmic chaperone n=1 Tax=Pseudomonas lactucae TaxID=2813360 RepID=A0A9X1C4H1_9PSED|nr:fimbria/pilus periplasmic chaperone [Pseudomonas lactucae]OPA97982.1 pilus assembly protein [Pseudomonas fluorescens]MBN2974618.1 fimbria/pilus periplasmic chaperone [Pseudomonas lactucae]MBN2988652.1 fimbria/pilus periplasmic chaperone [Pseudomonas lactucae]OPB14594.1 pilus assembly protein [Pseudomonas fluorescens]OPB27975.1 pilus assembly protein [Pseudomonas fluorescens]
MNATLISHLPAKLIALTFALFATASVQASVVISGTRIIYPQNDKEVTVRLESKNQAPVLIQAWLDDGNEHSTPDLGGIPFIATPPIFRMEPGKQQVVRLAYTGDTLPSTQESLFWFNVLEVPSQSEGAQTRNQLQLAFRSRIKLFFRPPNLPYAVEDAPAKLQWRRIVTEQGQALEVYNPTPYHVTFEQIDVVDAGQRHTRKDGGDNMVMPGSRNRFELPSLKSPLSRAMTVEFQTLDDFGLKVVHSAKVSS